jgi:ABC-type glycerol-3-phosphate transport system permease component
MTASTTPTAQPSPARRGRYRLWLRVGQIATYIFLVFISLVFLAPMFLMVQNSFKSDNEMYHNPVGLPEKWTLASYGKIFSYEGELWYSFVNSIIVSGSSTIIAVLLCASAAYAFAKYRFRGRELIFSLLLGTLMVPPEITIPGLYIIFAKLKWINQLQSQILPTITPILGLFLMRQYMLTIPDELLEAARVDGAGHFRVFWQIMVPVSTPVLGAYSILHFISVWNAYTWPVLVATKRSVQPIMVVLPQLVDPVIGFLPVWGTIMAGCVLSTLPLLTVFVIFQDWFLASMVVGAVKG